MSQNEQLREALLEIEVLRKREQAALRETRGLLEILRITTSSQSPTAALNASLAKASELLGADCLLIGSITAGEFQIEASTHAFAKPASAQVKEHFFSKPRNVTDVDRITHLSNFKSLFEMNMRSMLICALPGSGPSERVMIALSLQVQRFTNQDLDLLKRLIQMTAPALRDLELITQNALLAAVIDGSSSGFAIADAKDPELPLVFVNQAFETLTGYTAEDVLGQNCRFLSAEPPKSAERARLRDVISSQKTGQFLLRNKKKNGELFWNDLTIFPVYDADGEVAQIVATQTDATDRVEAEVQTRQARARLQDALDHTRDAYLLILEDGTVGFSNHSTREMFPPGEKRWQAGTTFTENWKEYLAGLPNAANRLPAAMLVPDLNGLCDQAEGIRTGLPDGRQVLFRAQKTSEGAIVVSATDTTAIRDTERLLRQRAAAVENAIDGIGILDADGRITYANDALSQMLGCETEASLLGKGWRSYYITPDNVDQLRAEVGISQNAQIYQVKGADGAKQIHEVTRTAVDRIGDVMVVRDISAVVRNRSRLAELNKQIEDGKRREEISNLAAGLAHDFNNVLSAISGSATLISTDPVTAPEIKSHADRISKAGATAARLVNRMLDLGAADDDAAIFDLRSVLQEVRALAEVNLASGAKLTVTEGVDALSIRAAVADITLVILNLVINANDALKEGHGTIGLSVSRLADATNQAPMVGRIQPDRSYAMIRVVDDGEGIPEDVLPNILQSFFTTKGDRGTGAGLTMVAAIVKRLGGALFVRSQIGQGTTVEVALPLVETAQGAEQPEEATADLSGMMLLVLDDQLDVAGVTAAFLDQCGAEVSVVDDPEFAIEAICEDPEVWTALITDYDMPKKSGGDVIEAIRKHAPDFPVFVVTALARRLSDPRITKDTVQGIFAKPTNLVQLTRAIEKLSRRP